MEQPSWPQIKLKLINLCDSMVNAPNPYRECQLSSWLRQFQGHTIRSVIIPLQGDFVAYLSEDGLNFADGCGALPMRGRLDASDSDDYNDWEITNAAGTGSSHTASHPPLSDTFLRLREHAGASSDGSSTCSEPEAIDLVSQFPELMKSMQRAIEELGGFVVPKLNWSCPIDAQWVNPGGVLSCTNAEQVVLMLKSSDRVIHDLETLESCNLCPKNVLSPSPSASMLASGSISTSTATSATASITSAHESISAHRSPESPAAAGVKMCATLTLRRYTDIRPEDEFRCFVRGHRLVAACQRDVSQHFPQLAHLSSDGSSRAHSSTPALFTPPPGSVQQTLLDFHLRVVSERFPLLDYTYDVYLSSSTRKPRIIDFNPVQGATSPLLFSWQELGYATESPAAAVATNDSNSNGSSAGVYDSDSATHGTQEHSTQEQSVTAVRDLEPSSMQFRVVEQSTGMQLGSKVACAMPFDMLMLQDGGVDTMVDRMREEGAARA